MGARAVVSRPLAGAFLSASELVADGERPKQAQGRPGIFMPGGIMPRIMAPIS